MELDSDLMRRIAAADTDAFTAFYDRHAPTVLGLLVKLLPQRNDAKDVLQETFCQVWRRPAIARCAGKRWVPCSRAQCLGRSLFRFKREHGGLSAEPATRAARP